MEQNSQTNKHLKMDIGSRSSEYTPQEGEYRDGSLIVEREHSVDIYDFYYLDTKDVDSGFLVINPIKCISIDIPDAIDDIEFISLSEESFTQAVIPPNMKTVSLADTISVHTLERFLIRDYFEAEGKSKETFVATIFEYLMNQEQ